MSRFNDEASFYINEQMNGVDESIPVFKYFYKNGELQCYLYKGIAYIGTWLEYWAKFQYENGEMFGTGPAHCRMCCMAGSKGGVMIAPCTDCAPRYNDYELGPGFNKFRKEATLIVNGKLVPSVYELHMKYVDPANIGRPVEPVIDESLVLECNEVQRKLVEKHGSSVDEQEAIESLMRFIKSFINPEEIRKKLVGALLIPDSKMYNQNWAGTDWDWFTGEINQYDEISHATFTEEERESIRVMKLRIRDSVAASRNSITNAEDNDEPNSGDEQNSGDEANVLTDDNNEPADSDVEKFFDDYFCNEYCVEEGFGCINSNPASAPDWDDKMLDKMLNLSTEEYLLFAKRVVQKHMDKNTLLKNTLLKKV